MSGSEIACSEPKPINAGHAPACDPAYTPFDAHPMLMLVPIATNRSPDSVERSAATCPVDAMGRAGDVGETSEHPTLASTARSGNSFVVVDIGLSSVGGGWQRMPTEEHA
jgi:hypothetical protein